MRDDVEALVQIGPGEWRFFHQPARIVAADGVGDVPGVVAEAERLTRDYGHTAVGFLTYEAGAAYGLPTHTPRAADPGALPFAWFACFEPTHIHQVPAPEAAAPYTLGPLRPSVDRAAFTAAFDQIKQRIATGDTYQVNYTFRLDATFAGDAHDLFADLAAAQDSRYGVFLRMGRRAICCATPELFFACQGPDVVSRPMKGTVRRGRTLEEDEAARAALVQSPKQRAENVMIVDMARNDLGRIAEVGSVRVPALFVAERYPNVWQMTSTVEARSFASVADIFAAAHPPASITGAPKASTMGILRALEPSPRGIYPGAIGVIPPDGNASFGVAIRTAVVDEDAGTASLGVGSGIVWDSEAAEEYDECLLKGSILGRRVERFELLETLRWSPDEGFVLLERHLARLAASAEYFGFTCDLTRVREILAAAVAGPGSTGAGVPVAPDARRVRFLVARDGTPRAEQRAFEPTPVPLRLRFAAEPVDPSDVFLFHKTTRRSVYDRARRADADDTVLWNPDGEVTETTVANLVVEIDGARVTPPLSSGLLPGTCRAEMLATGRIREGRVTIEAVRRAARMWTINSVHGWREAILVTLPE